MRCEVNKRRSLNKKIVLEAKGERNQEEMHNKELKSIERGWLRWRMFNGAKNQGQYGFRKGSAILDPLIISKLTLVNISHLKIRIFFFFFNKYI